MRHEVFCWIKTGLPKKDNFTFSQIIVLQSHNLHILKKTDNLDKPGSAACQSTRSLPFPVDVLLLFNCAPIFGWHHCLFMVFTTIIIDITCLLVIYVDEVVSLVVYVDSDANVTHSSTGHQCCFKTLFSTVFAQVSLSLHHDDLAFA